MRQLRVALHDLKDKPTKNLKGNIQDYCNDSTFYYNRSGHDLSGLQNNNEIKFVQGMKSVCIA